MEQEKELLKQHFKCDDIGKVKDYIGCKLDIAEDGRSLKMTQPVLVQSLTDEFKNIIQGKSPTVPAKTGNILTKCKNTLQTKNTGNLPVHSSVRGGYRSHPNGRFR